MPKKKTEKELERDRIRGLVRDTGKTVTDSFPKKNKITGYGDFVDIVSRVVENVELTGESGDTKKKVAKEIINGIIDLIPVKIKFKGIPIPSFIVKKVLKAMAGWAVDRVVDMFNKSGKFSKDSG